MAKLVECPICEGLGCFRTFLSAPGRNYHGWSTVQCTYCCGVGQVAPDRSGKVSREQQAGSRAVDCLRAAGVLPPSGGAS